MTTPPQKTSLPSHPKSKSSLHSSHQTKVSKLKEGSNSLEEDSHNDSHTVPDDWTSSSGSSSSDEESESEDDDDENNNDNEPDTATRGADDADDPAKLTHIHPFPKPTTKFSPNSELRDRLSQFIPALRAANEELERDIAAGNTRSAEISQEDGGEGQGRYIEMDLGLGVLEEKKGGDTDTESSDGDEDEGLDEEMSGQPPQESQKRKTQKSRNVMGKLLGEETKSKKPTIEEVDR